MDWLVGFILLLACFGAGATGAIFPPGEWYERLQRPSWTPPNWMFPVVWTSLYILMALAGGMVAQKDGGGIALACWALQITMNSLWTPVFFGLRRMREALFVMAGLWVSVLAMVTTHASVDIVAGILLLPYLIWVTVAGALNVAMVRLNRDVRPLRIDQLP